MSDDAMLQAVRDHWHFFGAEYPDPPEPQHHNRAGRRKHERARHRFWQRVRRDYNFVKNVNPWTGWNR